MTSDQQLRWRLRVDPLVISVNALGLTQITAWGTSFYCLGVLAKPIAQETGWTSSTVFLGFSVALVVMGLISTGVGRLIDRIGARLVMSLGAVVVSAGLFALAQVRDPLAYFALYGAYASTVFWVIGHYLDEAYGWRGTLMIFAAINLAV